MESTCFAPFNLPSFLCVRLQTVFTAKVDELMNQVSLIGCFDIPSFFKLREDRTKRETNGFMKTSLPSVLSAPERHISRSATHGKSTHLNQTKLSNRIRFQHLKQHSPLKPPIPPLIMRYIPTLTLLLALTPFTLAGINCKGSLVCHASKEPWMAPRVATIASLINALPNDLIIPNGKSIACAYRICAFLQHTDGGLRAGEVKELAAGIVSHGCDDCGSCPVGYPGENKSKKGELTFNFVQRDKRCTESEGVCPEILVGGEDELTLGVGDYGDGDDDLDSSESGELDEESKQGGEQWYGYDY